MSRLTSAILPNGVCGRRLLIERVRLVPTARRQRLSAASRWGGPSHGRPPQLPPATASARLPAGAASFLLALGELGPELPDIDDRSLALGFGGRARVEACRLSGIV